MQWFFRKHAGWFVLAGWLLVPLTVLAWLAIGVSAGISAFYHPLHQLSPFNRFDAQAVNYVLAASALAAIVSLIAFAMKLRLVAVTLVLGCWITIAIAVPSARSLVKPGPELFQRFVAEQRFSVPWQYAPRGEERPNKNGFSVMLCSENLRGTYDEKCRDGNQVTIAPIDSSRTHIFNFDERFWRTRLSEMTSGPSRFGHQQHIYTSPADKNGRTLTTVYLTRQDTEGKLTRLVVCRSHGKCQHHTAIGNYAISFIADKAALTDWGTMDGRLRDLVDTWAVR